MLTDHKEPWILVGYDRFAKEGPGGLKIEVIARMVKKSKSSFYHHFADVEIFTGLLLDYHLERTHRIAQRELTCERIIPDLINVLLDVKQDLLFNRQLRVNRHNPAFNKCLEMSNQKVEGAFLDLWIRDIGLTDKTHLARPLFSLALENFYLQLTEDVLTYDWLQRYFSGLRSLVTQFKSS